MTIQHRLIAAAVAVSLSAMMLPGAVAEERTPLEMTRKLIEESSGAKRIVESGVAEAQAQHEKARALLKQAQEAQIAGKSQRASELIKQARTTMFEAVPM